jgi:hypothetical protein
VQALILDSTYLYHRPGFKRQLMFQDVTAKYCIYDKVPSLPMSFFVRIKGLCQLSYDDLSI